MLLKGTWCLESPKAPPYSETQPEKNSRLKRVKSSKNKNNNKINNNNNNKVIPRTALLAVNKAIPRTALLAVKKQPQKQAFYTLHINDRSRPFTEQKAATETGFLHRTMQLQMAVSRLICVVEWKHQYELYTQVLTFQRRSKRQWWSTSPRGVPMGGRDLREAYKPSLKFSTQGENWRGNTKKYEILRKKCKNCPKCVKNIKNLLQIVKSSW